MTIVDDYAKDLKSKDELEVMLDVDIRNIKSVTDVYEKIDKLQEIYYYINVYDKYYNIFSSLNRQENKQTDNIIALYGKYNFLYIDFHLL